MKIIENEEIVSYLKVELKSYEKILDLILEQENTIKSKHMQNLNSLIKKKEFHVNNIINMKRRNTRLQEQIMSGSENIMSDKRIITLLSKIQSIIIKAMNHNLNNIKLISSALDTLKVKAGNLNKKSKMASMLRMQQFKEPRYLDVLR